MIPKWYRVSRVLAVTSLVAGVVAGRGSAQAAALPAVDDSDRVFQQRSVHPYARPEFDKGRADVALPMERMVLSVSMSATARRQLERFLANQQNPASPDYQRWLTPEEFGRRFGRSNEEMELIQDWLGAHGFRIDEVAAGRGWINFSGTAADVEQAFGTEIHDYEVNGKIYRANVADASLPRALSRLVDGVVSLHSFPRQRHESRFRAVDPQELTPEYTSSSGSHYVAPADFATIYNLPSLYSAGIDGTGQTVAIVGRTDISLADVQYFRSYFGLPAKDPIFVHNGADPGNLGGGEEGEADLDVQWSGAVARGATIKFVISKSTTTTDGVDLSAQYIVNNNLASVMSTSFGACESSMGSAELAFYNSLWAQAAAQGITSMVSSGDSGAAGCSSPSSSRGSGKAVSGLCSTPNNVCVGGTQYADTSNPSAYWAATNDATTKASALSYIPEIAWNESGSVSGGSGLWATGGGVSSTYSKPTWQSAPGVPSDGKRDVPDVSLAAGSHDGVLVFQGHTASNMGLYVVGGTSVASPCFAGVMALVDQKTGQRQGNANTILYQLGTSQYSGSGPVVFHDITSGNNSVPGVTGYSCGTGYDRATGLGSVDGAMLVNNWSASATPAYSVSVSPGSVSLVQGTSATATVTIGSTNGFNSAVSLSVAGLPSGVTATFSPASVTPPANGTATSSLALTASSSAAVGSVSAAITGASGSTSKTASLGVAVTAAGALAAVYNSTLKAPACASVGVSCDSGSLLNGRAGLGPELNQPNTIGGSCADGTSGTYHSDESNDRIKVSTTDGGSFAGGKTVRIDATVWAWTTPSADHLDLYYAANANSPSWTFIGTLTPTAAGAQTLSATYTLPAGSLQAVRANFRYQSSAGACVAGSYTDHDDLVFAVQ
jgi:pseudomonalisin